MFNRCSRSVMMRYTQTLASIPVSKEENQKAADLWDLHTDHLPTYAAVNDHRIGSANILNREAIHHIAKMPSWKNSCLTQLSKTSSEKYKSLSLREQMGIDYAKLMLVQRQAVGILCLQECSNVFTDGLKEILEPLKIAVVVGEGNRNNNVVTLVNRNIYDIAEVVVRPAFRRYIPNLKGCVRDEWRPIIDMTLARKNPRAGTIEWLRSINLHVSSANQGHWYKRSRLLEVAEYLKAHPSAIAATVISGDFNAPKAMRDEVFADTEGLCNHHTQFENVDVENPEIVAIDDNRFLKPLKSQSSAFERRGIPLEEIDPTAAATYQKLFEPVILRHHSSK